MFPATTNEGGVHTTAGPLDTCRTPSPGGPIPIPYANLVDGLAAAGDPAGRATQKTIIEQAAKKGLIPGSATAAAIGMKTSAGDEAGTAVGISSSTHMGKIQYGASSKIKTEGRGVVRMTRPTMGNTGNRPVGTTIAPSQSKVILMG